MIFLTFFLGLIANFIGYIPPGNINLTLVQITINRGFKQGMYFIAAFSSMEFFFTLFIMHAANWLSGQLRLDTIIDWIMIILFSTLGIVTWGNRTKLPQTDYSKHESIRYGIILGLLNPMQIPFWMFAGTYLITHEWILTGFGPLIIFSIGSALGAFLCLLLYAKFSSLLIKKFALSTKLINTSIGILFFGLAAYHIFKQIYLVFIKNA